MVVEAGLSFGNQDAHSAIDSANHWKSLWKQTRRVMFSTVVPAAALIAAMFFIALTVHLSRTSQFADSRRAALQAARSLFRNDRATVLARKIKAIEDGFAAAVIA